MIDKEEYNKLIDNEYNADKYCEDLPALFKYVKENDKHLHFIRRIDCPGCTADDRHRAHPGI